MNDKVKEFMLERIQDLMPAKMLELILFDQQFRDLVDVQSHQFAVKKKTLRTNASSLHKDNLRKLSLVRADGQGIKI